MKFIHVGVGGFGRTWVNLLHKDPLAEVVALVDVSADSLKWARETCGYSEEMCFGSLEEALTKVKADAIMCSTPPRFHRHDVVTALKAGLHALSEKPMADSLDDCKAMLRAARETGKTYCVSQNYRYNAPMWSMRKALEEANLGAVGQVKMDFYLGNDFRGGFRHEMPYPLIIDMSIHHFDLLRYHTGLNPVSVQATSWNPPWSNYKGDCSSTVLFVMDNGARVVYNASWCAKGQPNDWNCSWYIECERGALQHHRGTVKVFDVPTLYSVTGEREVPVVAPEPQSQAYVLKDFVESIAAGRKPLTDVTDNIHSVAMVFATVKAMETGTVQPILDDEVKALLAN